MPIIKNELHTVTVAGYSSDGDGVARIDGQVVFVKGAIDGETLRVQILRTTKAVAWAKIAEIITPSPLRQTPACKAFGPCGGCDFLHMDYSEELRLKHTRVIDALARVGGLRVDVRPILGAERQEHYRNKAIFAVGNGPVTGFYRRRSHQIIPVDACLIQGDTANRATLALRAWMSDHNVPAYDEATGEGLIRNLFVRDAQSTGKAAVCIVATKSTLPAKTALIDVIRHHCPEAVSILLCVNPAPGNVVLRGKFLTLWGDEHLTDTLSGLHFRLSPLSFFQVNPAQAERLYAQALTYANLTGKEVVLDLYCGTGTITLLLAKHAKHAIGAEIVAEAIRDARENAEANDISNVEFLLADAAIVSETLKSRALTPDVVVVDPPRKGLAPEVIDQIADLAPERVVYVSCDPATLARDLGLFATLGYVTTEVTPVDMFPRCAHVECVAQLVRTPSLSA
ncbi:MAG: 23S rRNA (uracil(1939)-C(5))-methyltransferase RlmD [Oscillospiraceae bacterium]|nr:23S rRNA (uracil(1939)-C(5))-methyltransferase RlmD [Oscillospiraceae bacterium]